MLNLAALNSFIFLIRISVFFSLRGESLKLFQAGSAFFPRSRLTTARELHAQHQLSLAGGVSDAVPRDGGRDMPPAARVAPSRGEPCPFPPSGELPVPDAVLAVLRYGTGRVPKGFAPLGVPGTRRAGGQEPLPRKGPPRHGRPCPVNLPGAGASPASSHQTGALQHRLFPLCGGPQTCNQSPLGCIFSEWSGLAASRRPDTATPHPRTVTGLPPPCTGHSPVPPAAGTLTAHAPARRHCLGGRDCLAGSQQLGWGHQLCCGGDGGGLAPSSLLSSSSPPTASKGRRCRSPAPGLQPEQ